MYISSASGLIASKYGRLGTTGIPWSKRYLNAKAVVSDALQATRRTLAVEGPGLNELLQSLSEIFATNVCIVTFLRMRQGVVVFALRDCNDISGEKHNASFQCRKIRGAKPLFRISSPDDVNSHLVKLVYWQKHCKRIPARNDRSDTRGSHS